jgi:hypothetical protein
MEFKLTCPAGHVRHSSDLRRVNREAWFELKFGADAKLNF